MALGKEVGLVTGDIVLDGDPSLRKKGGTAAPTFRPMYCAQTAAWIKMALGTEVGLSPGHIVLDGDPAPVKGAQPPIFGPYLLWHIGRPPSQLLLSTLVVQLTAKCHYTPCLKKTVPPLACYNFDAHEWILIFFGRNVKKEEQTTG